MGVRVCVSVCDFFFFLSQIDESAGDELSMWGLTVLQIFFLLFYLYFLLSVVTPQHQWYFH